ncbi:HIT family protein [Flexivirga alba]|uniref:HIT family protein n=1 Tax=Flexivirga alba TaxID=702742 RepID=A0ABW2ADL1_9MICO
MVPPIEVPKRSCGYCDNFDGVVPPHGPPGVVHHDDRLYVILAPSSLGKMPGHTLIIPTRHVETFLDLTDDETAEVAIMTRRVATAVRNTFNPNGIHVQQHNGIAAWQTVPHVPFHVIPVMADDDWPPDPDHWIEVTPSGERQAQAAALKEELSKL